MPNITVNVPSVPADILVVLGAVAQSYYHALQDVRNPDDSVTPAPTITGLQAVQLYIRDFLRKVYVENKQAVAQATAMQTVSATGATATADAAGIV